MSAQRPQAPVFALAGKLVSKSTEARRIWRASLRDGREWIVPQARSVYIKLKRVEALDKEAGSTA